MIKMNEKCHPSLNCIRYGITEYYCMCIYRWWGYIWSSWNHKYHRCEEEKKKRNKLILISISKNQREGSDRPIITMKSRWSVIDHTWDTRNCSRIHRKICNWWNFHCKRGMILAIQQSRFHCTLPKHSLLRLLCRRDTDQRPTAC